MKRLFIIPCLFVVATAMAELPESTKTTAKQAGSDIGRALALLPDAGEENLLALAKGLKALGYGQPPTQMPPWFDAESIEDPKVREDREAEMKVRMKRIGEEQLTFLKFLDTDGDRATGKTEVQKSLVTQLEAALKERLEADGDDDGQLSLSEYALVVPAKGEISEEDGVDWHQRGHFQEEDRDGNGVLNAAELLFYAVEEYRQTALRMRAALALANRDRDSDGILTKAEVPALWKDQVSLSSVYPDIYWFASEKLQALAK